MESLGINMHHFVSRDDWMILWPHCWCDLFYNMTPRAMSTELRESILWSTPANDILFSLFICIYLNIIKGVIDRSRQWWRLIRQIYEKYIELFWQCVLLLGSIPWCGCLCLHDYKNATNRGTKALQTEE